AAGIGSARRSESLTPETTDEIHDHLERTFARFATGIRERPKTDSGSVPPLEKTRQLQDRDVHDPRRRLGRLHVGGVRRSGDGAQVLLHAAGVYVRSAAGDSSRGRNPRRTRSDGLSRRAQAEVTSAAAGFSATPATTAVWCRRLSSAGRCYG